MTTTDKLQLMKEIERRNAESIRRYLDRAA